MAAPSSPVYRFGDLLALARQAWITQMRSELDRRGYPDYRRSDALVLRLLQHGPVPIGRLGDSLGVTRQAARKIADTLARRGFATTERDAHDGRQINIVLTAGGEAYGEAVVAVIDQLNRDLAHRVTPGDLAAADTVLRVTLIDDHTRNLAAHVPRPHPTRIVAPHPD